MISRRILPFAVLLLAVSASLSAQTKPPKKKAKAKPSPATQPAPVATQPAPPPTPLTLAQKPAVAPKVQYQNGELTIVAENSTLGDILRAVHQQTGAVVDLPLECDRAGGCEPGPGPLARRAGHAAERIQLQLRDVRLTDRSERRQARHCDLEIGGRLRNRCQ